MISRAMTIIAVLVAVGATLIGTVAKVEPTLFLKIPEVGFLFWALLAGGELPRTVFRSGPSDQGIVSKMGQGW